MGEYSIEQSLCLSHLPTLKSYGKISTSMQVSSKQIKIFDGQFIKGNTQVEESEDKAILNWLYRDEEESVSISTTTNINVPMKQYGKGFSILEKMRYEGQGPIGKKRDDNFEPFQLITKDVKDKKRLGYKGETQVDTKEEISKRILQLRDGSLTDSNEYEWEFLSNESYKDIQIDVIQKYAPTMEGGQSSGLRPVELESQNIDESSEDNSNSSEIDILEESTTIDLRIPIRRCIDFTN